MIVDGASPTVVKDSSPRRILELALAIPLEDPEGAAPASAALIA